MSLLFLLIISHAVCDYPLQTDPMARGKGMFSEPLFGVPWFYWLTSHALVHAGGVFVVTQRIDLALAEFVAHWMIDIGKCRKVYGIHVDQALHVLCKVAWVVVMYK